MKHEPEGLSASSSSLLFFYLFLHFFICLLFYCHEAFTGIRWKWKENRTHPNLSDSRSHVRVWDPRQNPCLLSLFPEIALLFNYVKSSLTLPDRSNSHVNSGTLLSSFSSIEAVKHFDLNPFFQACLVADFKWLCLCVGDISSFQYSSIVSSPPAEKSFFIMRLQSDGEKERIAHSHTHWAFKRIMEHLGYWTDSCEMCVNHTGILQRSGVDGN